MALTVEHEAKTKNNVPNGVQTGKTEELPVAPEVRVLWSDHCVRKSLNWTELVTYGYTNPG
jgi:hypothetical protein